MLEKLGKTLAMLFALGSGISVAGVFLMLHVTGIAIVVYPIVGVFFAFVTFTSYRMTRFAVPQILNDIFGKDRLFQGLFEKKDGTYISDLKSVFMGGGIILALAVGVTFGALNYAGAITLGAMFSLGVASMIVPPIAIFFSVIVLIVMSALMLNSIATMIKIDNLLKVCRDVLRDLINMDPELSRNRDKSPRRIFGERCVTVGLVVLFLPLSVLGTVMIMHACTSCIGNILLRIPHAIPTAVLYASNAIALVFALAGQLPFVVKTAVISANEAFAKDQPEIFCKNEMLNAFLNKLVLVSRIITAIGMGIAAVLGTHNPVVAGLGFVGSTVNNFASATNDPPPASERNLPLFDIYSPPVNFKDPQIGNKCPEDPPARSCLVPN